MTTNPDGTSMTAGYDKGKTTLIDANGHKKVEERDVYGRLIKVEEYTGVSPSFSLYATTTYQYDVLGNLTKVIDAANNQTIITYDTLSRKTSMSDPDMGTWTYSYDASGNLIFQTDAKTQTITFTYDAINRIIIKDYTTGMDVIYTYDEIFSTNAKGRLTTVTDASGTEKFYYDKLGRVVKAIKTVDGIDYTTETGYDALGRTVSIKYPDNETASYSYDTGGNLSQVTGYATYSGYNALGQAGTITYGNGATTTYLYYSSNNRLYSITSNSPAAGGLQNFSYTYNNAGNITGLTDLMDSNRTQTFTYDDINRLTYAQSGAYGTLSYSYSPIGNMTYNTQIGDYTYGTKPHAVTQAGANTYTYDDNGNMTGGGGRTISYDYDNRSSDITYSGVTTYFVYDHSGERTKKSASTTTVYIGKLYECTSGVCTKYIFAGGQRVASKRQSAIYYYHTDHLDSSSVITDAGGGKVEEIYYYPYGGTRFNQGSVDVGHKYTGQEEDAETGLYYYGTRYYNPQLGRFISPDSIVPDFSDPQALNRYSYVRNNPLIYIDPTGHSWLSEWWDDFKDSDIGAAIEVVVGITLIAVSPACGVCGTAGAVLAGHGMDQLGANVEVEPQQSTLITWGNPVSSGGGTNGSTTFEYWDTISAIGGEGNCTRCMPGDVVPPGEYWQLDYHSLLEGNEAIISRYGQRYLEGKWEFHGAIDVAPRPQTGRYGIPLFAPSNGQIHRVTYGGIYFRPDRFPPQSSLFFYHVSLSPNLAERVLPIHVYTGTQIGTIEKIGRTEAPHVHIQLDYGGRLYNPIFVFPY